MELLPQGPGDFYKAHRFHSVGESPLAFYPLGYLALAPVAKIRHDVYDGMQADFILIAK